MRLEAGRAGPPYGGRAGTPTKAGTTGQAAALGSLDMTQSIEKKMFRYTLEKQQGRLNELERRARERGISTVAVFEGWDAAGKGGALRRVTAALDGPPWRRKTRPLGSGVEWRNAAVRRGRQDAGVAAGWRAFLLCSRR